MTSIEDLALDDLLADAQDEDEEEDKNDGEDDEVAGEKEQEAAADDSDILSPLVLTPDEQAELLRALEGFEETDELTATSSSATTPTEPPQPLLQTMEKKPKRRKRQSDEVRYLAHQVRHLEAELSRLQHQQHALTAQAVAAAGRLRLLPHGQPQMAVMVRSGAVSRADLWERIAVAEREETRVSMLENARLRAQYESHLLVARRLETLYLNQFSFAVMDALPDTGYLARCTRMDALSDDASIFASLGRDFDAQYAQTDSVLEACGLTSFEGELQREMQLKRDETGRFCLENTLSKVVPFDMHTIDRVFWHCMSSEQLQTRHSVYQIHHVSSDAIFTKTVDPLHLPHAAVSSTTLTMWIAMKRFVEEHRVVAVCEAVIATTGSTCVRVTPEIGGSFSPHELAVGTLTNLLIGSYHRHKELMHQVAENLLVSQFTEISV